MEVIEVTRGDKLQATVAKDKGGLPTVLMVDGHRYVLDIPRTKKPQPVPTRLVSSRQGA